MANASQHTAIWALTPDGAHLAGQLAGGFSSRTVFLKKTVAETVENSVSFSSFKEMVDRQFNNFSQHVFIMATGIVVRCIAAHLVHKTKDPAVVVCDEAGHFAISLVSGHVGGANALAEKVASLTGGQPVITTATDVKCKPAIDLIAKENRLIIENPAAIKAVNMALLTDSPIYVHDPFQLVTAHLPTRQVKPFKEIPPDTQSASVFVDHKRLDLPPEVLVLRPGCLVAGMGCNRGTDVMEMRELLEGTFEENRLSLSSLRCIASVDLKADEPGLLALADSLGIEPIFFSRQQLDTVAAQVPTPSATVQKHIGVQSVCEAAALLATPRGRLIVPKRKTANVTLAVAIDSYSSSASDPEALTT